MPRAAEPIRAPAEKKMPAGEQVRIITPMTVPAAAPIPASVPALENAPAVESRNPF